MINFFDCRWLSVLLFLPLTTVAQWDDRNLLPTPSLPPAGYEDGLLERDVTITETETEVIYEYRINGQVYMVKVDPIAGPPYYFFDHNGDGELDIHTPGPPAAQSVQQWLLFSW